MLMKNNVPSRPSVLEPLEWLLGESEGHDVAPSRWICATVPGAVQMDWAEAEGWPPYWFGANVEAYQWMENRYWTYRTRLPARPVPDGKRWIFHCGGVDYACSVKLDGRAILEHEGMQQTFELDVTEACAAGAVLEVQIHPAPKVTLREGESAFLGRESRQSCKPAVAYGWDFHPRLIPLGIWQKTGLNLRDPENWLGHSEVQVDLIPDHTEALLTLHLEGIIERVRWTVLDPCGSEIATLDGRRDLQLRLKDPRLWWPRTEGKPILYTSRVELLGADGQVADVSEQKFGVRQIRLVMAEGQYAVKSWPPTQATAPMTIEINGRRIFARGANWVAPEIFPSRLTRERYAEQLTLVRDANLNFLRCWGGSLTPSDDFYDFCDEAGILVWQDFPLSCNHYEGTPAYLEVLNRESRAIIRRLRRRASLAVWCGGNELFNSWSEMTMQDHAIRLLDRNCFDLDPGRPFVPTTPIYGVRHGDYRFRFGDGPRAPTVFEVIQKLDATAYMEFGIGALSDESLLRRIIPVSEIWPPSRSPAWLAHHGFGAWPTPESDYWIEPATIEAFFGASASLGELVARSQLLQAVGLKAIYEEARRQKPTCSAAACWVFNEPWPTAANASLVAWPNHPKPALQTVAEANRPVMASARIPEFAWEPGAEFSAELHLLNDSPCAIPSMQMRAELDFNGNLVPLGEWHCPGTDANTHSAGPTLCARLPDAPRGSIFKFRVIVEGCENYSSTYRLAILHTA